MHIDGAFDNRKKDFSEELKKRFPCKQKFTEGHSNKFGLMFEKSIYPQEYMDDWEKFNEELLPIKKSFTVV